MVGFLQAQNCSIAPGSWRHPAAATDFLTPDYFTRVARVLEDGKFHLAFFDDRLAMPDIYGRDHVAAVENGIRVVKMDPVTILDGDVGGDLEARPRRHLLDHLLRAVPRRAAVRDAGPDDPRAAPPGTS